MSGACHRLAQAAQAAEDFAREVQQGGVPSDIECFVVTNDVISPRGASLPKLMVASALAPSRTEAERLLKSGAVEVNGAPWKEYQVLE